MPRLAAPKPMKMGSRSAVNEEFLEEPKKIMSFCKSKPANDFNCLIGSSFRWSARRIRKIIAY
jgi:hypothetical protein